VETIFEDLDNSSTTAFDGSTVFATKAK